MYKKLESQTDCASNISTTQEKNWSDSLKLNFNDYYSMSFLFFPVYFYYYFLIFYINQIQYFLPKAIVVEKKYF